MAYINGNEVLFSAQVTIPEDEGGGNIDAETLARIAALEAEKLDKVTDTTGVGNFGSAYIINPNGEQKMMPITNTTGGGTLPIRGMGGVIVVGTPADGAHAATKQYVDEGLAKKVNAKVFSSGGSRVYAARINDPNAFYYISSNPSTDSIPVYMPMSYNSYSETPTNKATLIVSTPEKPYQCTNKKYVDDAVASVQSELEMLGKFYEVVKVESSSGTPFLDIPNGAMGVAYVESASLVYDNTDGSTAGESGISAVDFCENWSTISSAQPFNAQGYISIPEGANQIYFNAEYNSPPSEWDAGPYWFEGAIYFMVKRG